MTDDLVRRALIAGASRSLRACSENALVPRHVELWRRHKWKVAGLRLFLLIDLILLGGLGSTVGTHF